MIAFVLLLAAAQASASAGVRCAQRNNSSACEELSFCSWQQEKQCNALCFNLNSFPALCVDNKCDYVDGKCISPEFQQNLPPPQQDVFCYRYDLEQDCLKWPEKCSWSEEARSCGLVTKEQEPGVPAANLPPTTTATSAPSSVQESVTNSKCQEIKDAKLCSEEAKCEYVDMLCQDKPRFGPSSLAPTTTVIEIARRGFDIDFDYWTVVCSAIVVASTGAWVALPANKRRSFSRLFVVRLLQITLLCAALAFFFLAEEADYVLIGFTAYATALLLSQCVLRARLSRFAMEAGLFFTTPFVAAQINVNSPLQLSGGVMLEFACGVLPVFAHFLFYQQDEREFVQDEFGRSILEFSMRCLSSVFGVLLLVIDFGLEMDGTQIVCALAIQLVCILLVAIPMFHGRAKFGMDCIGLCMSIVVGERWPSLCMIYLWGSAIGMGLTKQEFAVAAQVQQSPAKTKVFPPTTDSNGETYNSPAMIAKRQGMHSAERQRRSNSERRRNRPVNANDPSFEPQLANV